MYNLTIPDNAGEVLMLANPRTTPSVEFVDGRPAPCQNFSVQSADSNTLEAGATPGNPSTGDAPTFYVKPKVTFFGADRVVNVVLTGLVPGSGGSQVKNETMSVTIQGTQPDDGKLDHFSPSPAPVE